MTPQAEDSARLQELLGEMYAERAARVDTQSAVIDVVLARLRCARVSMWKFDRVGDELTLLCFASKTAEGVFDISERRLYRSEFIDYFNSLVDAGTYMSVDAMSDPVLQRSTGMRPVISSKSTTPSEKRSARASTGRPSACSGAM